MKRSLLYYDLQQFNQDPDWWIRYHSKAYINDLPNIWFSIPQWWWCKLEHVQFYEKLEHVKAIRGKQESSIIKNAAELHVTSEWISPDEVMEKWKMALVDLELRVRKMRLPIYHLDKKDGIQLRSEEALSRSASLFNYGPLHGCLFKSMDVKKLERKDHAIKLKTKRTPRDRDIERVTKLMEKIKKKKQPRNITDKKLAEVIHWALSTDKPYFFEADKYDWVRYLVPDNTGQFEIPHAESWVRQRIRDIQKKKPGRPPNS